MNRSDNNNDAATSSSTASSTARNSTTAVITWQSGLAGYIAGISGVLIGHPLDSAKVWLQTNSVGRNQHLQPQQKQKQPSSTVTTATSPSSSSFTTTTNTKNPSGSSSSSSSVFRTIRALYSGVTVPLVSVGIVQSINFAIYDATRRYLYYSVHNKNHQDGNSNVSYLHDDPISNVAIAGFTSGAGLAVCTSPIILLKTKQQITGIGFVQAFQKTFSWNQRRTFFVSTYLVGFVPHLACETIGRAIYYSTYEYCKRTLLLEQQHQERNREQQQSTTNKLQLPIPETMLCAGFAGILCWGVIFPIDSLRNRMYHQHVISLTDKEQPAQKLSTIRMALFMIQERSLYRGFTITVLRAGPVAAVILPIYDRTLQYLIALE